MHVDAVACLELAQSSPNSSIMSYLTRACELRAGLCDIYMLDILLTWKQKLYKQQPVVTWHDQVLLGQ